jgi:hypothetical protein
MKIIGIIEDEEVIEKILKHPFDYAQDRLGLWEMKARPPPNPKASFVTMHLDYSDSQILRLYSVTPSRPILITRSIPT